MKNPLIKAPLIVVAITAILYALLPPSPQETGPRQPYAIDLTVPPENAKPQTAPPSDPLSPRAPAVGEQPVVAEAGEAVEVETVIRENAEAPQAASTESAAADGTAPGAPADSVDAEQVAAESVAAEPQGAVSETESPAGEPAEKIPADSWITREIRAGDTMAKVFNELGLSPTLLAEVLDCGQAAKSLADIRPGQVLTFRLGPDGQLRELVHTRSSVASLRVVHNGEGYESIVEQKPIETRTHTASSTIHASLFEDGQRAGLSDGVIMAFAELFNWDIDFARELHQGDRFSVIYEAGYVDGEKFRDGDILAAEFVNDGKSFRAIRYADPDGTVEYYAPDGSAKKKAFIKTPVKFSRISSGFTKKRWHPILKRWRSHKGVDYAAPTGTPVKASGKGKVKFIGRQQGYGKVIHLQHGDRYSTLYGHLSRFSKGLKKGDTVTQGEVIGYVGQTGLATGPHLHYEFRVNGKHVDPLSHKLPTSMPLPKRYMADFKRHADPLVEQLNLLSAPRVAETE